MAGGYLQGLTRTAAVLAAWGIACGQNAEAPHQFEVASIKASRVDAGEPRFEISPSGAININTTVKSLIFLAYPVKDFQLTGGPKWLDTEYYRVVAKPPAGAVPPVGNALRALTSERLRYLLEDRFGLKVHHENRNVPLYSLVVAKGGAKLKEVEHDAANYKLNLGQGRIVTRGGAKIGMLVSVLANDLHRAVIDNTGLTGYYDIQLTYSVDETKADSGPSLFAALLEQLGLRLESRTGPLDMVVIDHVERPSEN